MIGVCTLFSSHSNIHNYPTGPGAIQPSGGIGAAVATTSSLLMLLTSFILCLSVTVKCMYS